MTDVKNIKNNEYNSPNNIDASEISNEQQQDAGEFKFSVKIANLKAQGATDDSVNELEYGHISEHEIEISREDLMEQIKMAQDELDRRKEHSKKVEELNAAVEEWKADFARALDDIQQKFAFH